MTIDEQIADLRRYTVQGSEASQSQGGDEIIELVRTMHDAADTLTKLNAVLVAAEAVSADPYAQIDPDDSEELRIAIAEVKQ